MATEPQSQSRPAAAVTVPSWEHSAHRGDWFALKLWILCFLLMALMTAYDVICSLLR